VAGAGDGVMEPLNGHEAGNGGHSQGASCTPPRRSPTRLRRQDNQSLQFLRSSRPDLTPTPRFHDLSHVGRHDCPSQAPIAGLTGAASRKCADRRHYLAR
jgi:hypothetical protein